MNNISEVTGLLPIATNLVKIDGLLFRQLPLEFPLRGSSLVANALRVVNFV